MVPDDSIPRKRHNGVDGKRRIGLPEAAPASSPGLGGRSGDIDRFDEVRRFFLDHDDPRCVSLFLQAFGNGSGFGVYQLVEDVLRRYPPETVVPALDEALRSPHSGVRYWSLQIALTFPSRSLAPHFIQFLSSGDRDERAFGVYNLTAVARKEDESALRSALEREMDSEIREAIQESLENLRGTGE